MPPHLHATRFMRHASIDPALFSSNRDRLRQLLPSNALAIVNANDVLPTNGDGTLLMQPNSDLFYLSGIEQEQSLLLLAPDAFNPKLREILFLREPNEHLRIWEGHKLSKAEATKLSSIHEVRWLSELPSTLHLLMCEAEHVFLNSNENQRADCEVETRDQRFISHIRQRYPLHLYQRLAPVLHALRMVKSKAETDLIRHAIQITHSGFRRACMLLRPGITEAEVEAEFAHEFVRNRASFAYPPILASGANSCVLHYTENAATCRKGELLLLDVGARYANYCADITRTLPVSGRFTRRQKAVYQAVLRVLREGIRTALPGRLHRDWQQDAQKAMTEELLRLGLLSQRDLQRQSHEAPACRKFFMHGLGHPLGLDVHDVGLLSKPFAPGWILTVEPGIYLPEEGFGIRLENNILITANGPVDLAAQVPIEPEEIESLMAQGRSSMAS
jgi:Xaa-Pro aminopeptidase